MGAKKAYDVSIRYDQKNNIIERFLKDLKDEGLVSFWLESCNVEASACAVEAVDGKFEVFPPQFLGKPIFGNGDLLFAFLYSDYGQGHAPSVTDGVCENEVIKNLAFGINTLTTCTAEIVAKDIEGMKKDLDAGCAIVICYQTDYGMGHYICLVDYKKDSGTFVAYDSFDTNKHCKRGGILEEYPDAFFAERARPFYMRVKETL